MGVVVNKIAVHKVRKLQQEKADPVKFRETLLPFENNEDNTTYKFVDEFSKIYKNRRKTSRTFGEFEEDEEINPNPIAKQIREYLNGELDYYELSKIIATSFRAEVTDIPMATGGYVFCIDYSDNDDNCLAIVILTNKSGTSINDETMDLLSSFTLNIDEINMAVNIKINKWFQQESSYLSFIRGKKDVAQYFRKFIGCKPTESGSVVTNLVIDNVLAFIEREYPDNKEIKQEISGNLFIVMKQSTAGLSLQTVVNTVFPEEDIQDRFNDFLDEKEIEIPYDFIPDGRAYKRLVRLDYKTKNLDIRIDHSAFGPIAEFDKQTNFLIIKDPLIKQRFDELF